MVFFRFAGKERARVGLVGRSRGVTQSGGPEKTTGGRDMRAFRRVAHLGRCPTSPRDTLLAEYSHVTVE